MNSRSDEARLTTADMANAAAKEQSTPATEKLQSQDSRFQSERNGDRLEPLLPNEEAGSYEDRWKAIQIKFVDEPQDSTREADSLVAEVIQALAKRFADERAQLEKTWSEGAQASTEDLRQALQHYRSFFHRLLAA